MLKLKDYPREYMVGDAVWKLRFVRHIPHDQPGRICVGLAEPSEQVIYVKLGQDPEERLKTFLHELLHAIEYEYDISMPHRLIHKLEDPLARFLIDNYLPAAG